MAATIFEGLKKRIEEEGQVYEVIESMPDDVLHVYNAMATRRTSLEQEIADLSREVMDLRIAEDVIVKAWQSIRPRSPQ